MRIVAEIKARSPSAGEILPAADGKIETFALAYRRGHAAAISVVTEQDHFGGKPDGCRAPKRISGLPVAHEGLRDPERQLDFAVSLGADAVLLIVRALPTRELAELARGRPERGLATVVEAHGAAEIAAAAAARRTSSVSTRGTSRPSRPISTASKLARSFPPGRSGWRRAASAAARTWSASRPPATRRSSSARRSCATRIPNRP